MAAPPAQPTPGPGPSAGPSPPQQPAGFDWFGPHPGPGLGPESGSGPVVGPPVGGTEASAAGWGRGARRDPSPLRAFLTTPFTARTWREHAYLAATAPLALVAIGTLAALVYASIVLAVVLVGIPLLALTVLGARELVAAHRWLAATLLGEHVPAPRRRRPRSRGFHSWLRASLGDAAGWRAIAYLVVSFPVVVGGASLVALTWLVSLVCLSYPVVWQVFEPTQIDAQGVVRHSAMQFGDYYVDTWPRALAVAAVGLVGVLAVPWVARAFTTADRLLVRGLLGPSRLSERVVDLEVTRAQAVDASAAELRRIERDLHDGTQARLVALAMHLDMAKEKLSDATSGAGGADAGEADLARTRDLLDTAHRTATEAIVELREVTRSIHPPALDRGLDAALATLVARSGIPATLRADVPVRPSPAIETIAYFCVAELLTNAAKHSGARRVMVDVTGGPNLLRLRVTDDGTGGAHCADGGGLAGLSERVRTVDGELDIASPPGGPTVISVDLPSGA